MNLVSKGARSGHAKGHAKGFTLIELLVVIAIIGILSAVVLASLSTARSKGKDASVQESMSGMRTAMEIYYGNNSNSYGSMTYSATCATPAAGFADTTSNMLGLVTAVKAATTLACGSNGTAWVAAASLPSSPTTQQFCVDSTGAGKVFAGTLAASVDSTNFKCN